MSQTSTVATAWFSPSQQIRVYLNEDIEEVWMDADFGYSASEMRDALSVIDSMGYMVIPPEEMEPDIYDDFVRVYLCEAQSAKTFLMIMALPHADHKDFNPEWSLP